MSTSHSLLGEIFERDRFHLRQSLLSIVNKNYIRDGDENILAVSKTKLFKMKDEVKVYRDKYCNEKILDIKQDNVIDARAFFEVEDVVNSQTLGYIYKYSARNNSWRLFDPMENKIGEIRGLGNVMKRTSTGNLEYNIFGIDDPYPKGTIQEKYYLTKYTMDIYIDEDPDLDIDRRLILAMALCTMALKN